MSGFERALWVVRDRILTAHACDELLADAAERAIREIVVQVRGRADAYYRSSLEPRAEELADATFDPLAHLVRGGAAVGVRIHAWANIHLVWSGRGGAPPRSAEHLVRRHPEWLLRPQPVRSLDPVPGTLGLGLWVDPAHPDVIDHTRAVLADLAARYAVEGVHYDHVRYPQASAAASADDHRHVTAFVRQAAPALRAARDGIVVSAAVFADPLEARERVLQHWPEWARDGHLDLVCPMAYRRDTREVARLLGAARAAAPVTRMWGGLMGYPGEPALLREQVRAARDAGCEGAILFAYHPERRDLLDALADA